METAAAAGVIIRKASPADSAIIVSLGRKTFYDTFAEMNTPENMKQYLDGTFTLEKIEEEFSQREAVFFIAEVDKVPAGFAKVRDIENPDNFFKSPAMEIERIYAVRDFIGKGIGKALMQTCLDHARQKGYTHIWLGVWEHNQKAIEFYTKWGFQRFSQHVFMVGDDAQTDMLLQRKL